jgi:hypothetical protein
MSLTYTTYVATIANLMATSTSNTQFVQIFPAAADYANNRIYREGDFLDMQVTDTGTLTANNRNFTLPATFGKWLVVEQINVFTPASSTTTRNPVIPASLDLINALWQSDTAASADTVPQWFAMNQQETDGDIIITFGPPPGAAFTAEVIGSVLPNVISASNTTTFLSTFMPDILIAATMIFMSGYQKNFSAQADDPKMAMSWETQYKSLMAGADLVEARKLFQSQGWTAKQPAPQAAAPR